MMIMLGCHMFYYIQCKYHSWCVYMDGSVHHEDINIIESWNHCEETTYQSPCKSKQLVQISNNYMHRITQGYLSSKNMGWYSLVHDVYMFTRRTTFLVHNTPFSFLVWVLRALNLDLLDHFDLQGGRRIWIYKGMHRTRSMHIYSNSALIAYIIYSGYVGTQIPLRSSKQLILSMPNTWWKLKSRNNTKYGPLSMLTAVG